MERITGFETVAVKLGDKIGTGKIDKTASGNGEKN